MVKRVTLKSGDKSFAYKNSDVTKNIYVSMTDMKYDNPYYILDKKVISALDCHIYSETD